MSRRSSRSVEIETEDRCRCADRHPAEALRHTDPEIADLVAREWHPQPDVVRLIRSENDVRREAASNAPARP